MRSETFRPAAGPRLDTAGSPESSRGPPSYSPDNDAENWDQFTLRVIKIIALDWTDGDVLTHLHSERGNMFSSSGKVLVAIAGVLEAPRDISSWQAILVFYGYECKIVWMLLFSFLPFYLHAFTSDIQLANAEELQEIQSSHSLSAQMFSYILNN